MQTKLPDLADTIVALSSAAGPGGRAIVRLSGQRAADIAQTLCADFDEGESERGHFVQGKLRLRAFHAPIAADLYHFKAPHTYTGQDLVEIHLLSAPPMVEALIAQCLDAGARAAQAGEFTLRAFLAGKLDLTRAEAVLGVIEAKERGELTHALKQLAGGMAQPLSLLRDDLLNLLADVEAGLDFAEEDVHFIAADALLQRLGNALAHLTLLKKQIEQRALGQRPFRVVLAGKPNAGKSSLFNALVGQEAALVSAEPGTTRDYLQAIIDMDGVAVELVDTAGLGAASSAIDSAAQNLGAGQATDADLVLWCVACDALEGTDPPPDAVPLATKADLAPAPIGYLATSANTGAGLEALHRHLAQEVHRHGHAALAPSLSRCRHHVEACLQHLRHAHALVIDDAMPELLALEIRLALEEMGAMAGAVYTDDLLDRIFSRFCIGK